MLSARAVRDVFTVPIVDHTVNTPEYLSDVSPKEKPWDAHRAEADEVGGIYGASPVRRHWRYAERVEQCSQVLEFARDPPAGDQKQKLKLKNAWFCRVENLRYTLGQLAQAWKRLIELRTWPAQGWIRAVEITRSKDASAHPHYHSLLMVPATYFAADYLKQREWAELWRQCLRINYTPVVDVRVIRQSRKRSWLKVNQVSIPQMWSIVTEILKYSVKPSDMIRDHAWFLAMSDQVLKTRAVAVGGVLKQYLREHADLMSEPGEDPPAEIAERLFFGWKQEVRRYRKIGEMHVRTGREG